MQAPLSTARRCAPRVDRRSRKFLDGEAVPVALKASVPVTLADEATLNGIATYKAGTFALTQFTLKAGERALAGSASYKGSLLTLHPLTVNAGGNSLLGSAVADLSGAVPPSTPCSRVRP